MKTNYKAGMKNNTKSSARTGWAVFKASSSFRATLPKLGLRRQMGQPARGQGQGRCSQQRPLPAALGPGRM